jgi:hypothetical protein
MIEIEEVTSEPVKRNTELGYYANFVNLLDLCAMAVPSGFCREGLPFGVILSGHPDGMNWYSEWLIVCIVSSQRRWVRLEYLYPHATRAKTALFWP